MKFRSNLRVLALLVSLVALLLQALLLSTSTAIQRIPWDDLPDAANIAKEMEIQIITNSMGENTTLNETASPSVESQPKVSAGETNIAPLPRPHPHAGARYPDGRFGYIADPKALQRGINEFLQASQAGEKTEDDYWNVLVNYEKGARNGTKTGNEILSSEYICAAGPGRGLEHDGGYKILTEKFKIRRVDDEHSQLQHSAKILCAIYTYPRMRDLFRASALSWGHKCDGFLAFSTETVPNLGLVDLPHEGEESYSTMWLKVRSIWAYLHDNYLDEYDFFHLGGDDLFVIVENMRYFLAGVENKTDRGAPLFLGEWFAQSADKTANYMVTGRPGYTLNRAALSKLVKEGLPICNPHARVPHEDRTISNCFRNQLGIVGGDTRDQETGEQQYHGVDPNTLFITRSSREKRANYFSQQMAYWEILDHPSKELVSRNGSETVLVGPKHELEAAATYSVTLHDLYRPSYLARIHALLYKRTCPATSTLGRALRLHCIDD